MQVKTTNSIEGCKLVYLYLVYGISFIVLGVALSLLMVSQLRLLPKAAGYMLATFAISHGIFELIRMFQIVEVMGVPEASHKAIDQIGVFLLPFSYLALLGFGIEILVAQKKIAKNVRNIILIFSVFSFAIFVGYEGWDLYLKKVRVDQIEILTRFFVALPASLIAAYGFWTLSSYFDQINKTKIKTVLKVAAGVFVLYGVASSVLYWSLPADLKYPEHLRFVAPAMIVFRTSLALALCFLLSEAFFIEVSILRKSFQKMQEEFSSMMTHDLVNLTGQIHSSSEILFNELRDKLDFANQLAILKILHRSSKTLSLLVSDIYDLRQFDLKMVCLKKTSGDLCQNIAEICKRNASLFGERTLKIYLPTEKTMAFLDWDRIDQILSNLLTNSAKYSLPKTEVVVEVKVENSSANIFVTNMTTPLSEQEKSQLFSKYFRAKSNERSTKGTGLGLAIVRALVEAHGGNVSFQTTPEGQITFKISLSLNEKLTPIASDMDLESGFKMN